MKTILSHTQTVGLALTVLAAGGIASAQTADDALINKLVQKGILTAQEAGELKTEAKRDFDTAYRAKTGMPEWVSSLKFGGDFRGRYDGIFAENAALTDRNRLRYRLRFGVTAMLLDNFEVGLRLQTGEPVGNFGGNPISSNTTMADNGSKKFIGVGLAYAKWTPLQTDKWNGSLTFGKMEDPLEFPTALVFGKDYLPEGLAAQVAYKLNASHTLKLNAAAFVLDELAASADDPWLGAVQLRLDSAWTKKISSSVGVSMLGISNEDTLTNEGIPNVNRGNTRNASGAPEYGFNPVHADATFTYTLDKFPMYPGRFPISIGGEFLYNPAAPGKNEAWSTGFSLGKAGKQGQWSLCYRYMELQADAWFEEIVDVDFAAYYQQQQPNSGFNTSSNPSGAGYTGGTNIRGHIIKADYSPFNSLTFSVTWFMTGLVDASPANSESAANRVQVDAMWKF